MAWGLWHSYFVTTFYHTTADDLDEIFIEEIAVSEDDETGYLLRHPANQARLLRAIKDVDAGQNLITPDQAQFQ